MNSLIRLCFFVLLLVCQHAWLFANEEIAESLSLSDKTFVVWVSPTNLMQRGGSVLTLEKPGDVFDAIVFGEMTPGKWMAGSDGFVRTQRDQSAWAVETAGPDAMVQIAVVYRGKQVLIYRNGKPYASYTMDVSPTTFTEGSIVLLGLRHRLAQEPRLFFGQIDDARIYATALDATMIASLKANEPSDPKPLAWWSFEDGKAEDQMQAFPATSLVGAAKVVAGRLQLDGGYMQAAQKPARTRATEDWPVWHLTALPEEGHCLPYDTNGCIFWNGRYHLMYIFQSRGRPRDGHCWGHASSADLVNWTYHPASIELHPGEPDAGTFSGNAFINKDGKPMLCWYGIDAGVCVATAEDDDLIHWKKHPSNPIIPIPKPGMPGDGVYRVWDPYLWLEGDTYYCLLGGNVLPNLKDTLYTLKSKDLVHWTPMGPFYEHPDLSWTVGGEDCSCPDFFQFGDKRVLMCISHTVGARMYVGRYENEKFYPESHFRMNWPGGTFFAPESLLDSKGRRVFWAWIIDPRIRGTRDATGSGAQSMPRILSFEADGSPRIDPAPELQTLRRNPRKVASIPLEADTEALIPNVRGDSLELIVEIDPGRAREVGLKVRCSPDGKEETVIGYDTTTKMLRLDVSQSTLRKDVVYCAGPLDTSFQSEPRKGPQPCGVMEAPFVLKEGEKLKLRVFLDKPLLEVFVNDRQCLTQQIYPTSRAAFGIKAFARGGDARVDSGEAWDMAPARFVNETNR